MPYIPQRHKKYNLLPYCNKNGGEAFEYPSELLHQIDDIIPNGETLIPYGYKSYDEYFSYLDQLIDHYESDEKTKELLLRFRRKMIVLNQKETWAVVKYVGETTDDLVGLTYNKYYYCPQPQAVYDTFGVIDDEEFTSYMYSCNSTDWELYEDPTGEASKVLGQIPKTNMICPCCGKHYFLYASDRICPVCGWEHDTALKEKTAEDRDNYNALNEIKKRFNPTKIDITLLFTSAFKNLSKTQTAFICYEFDIDKNELFSFSERQLDCLYSTLKMFEWHEKQSNSRITYRYENIHRVLELIEEYFSFTLGNS